MPQARTSRWMPLTAVIALCAAAFAPASHAQASGGHSFRKLADYIIVTECWRCHRAPSIAI